MKIFVTGATGYLGRHLTQALIRDGHDITGIGSECDLRDAHALNRFTGPYDQIWHLAAWTQAGDFCLRHPAEQWMQNQKINTTVLDWWQQYQPQAKIITIGTSCAYDPDLPLTEDNYLKGEPIESLHAYGMTKKMLLSGLLAMQRQYDMKWLCLIPSTLFGPGYHSHGKQLHFIFDLIAKIVRGKHNGNPVVLWGDGWQCRELIYIDDFIAAALALNAAVSNEVINVGAGSEYPIRWFAERICEAVGYDPALIQFDTSRYVGARSKCISTQKLERILPEFKRSNLSASLLQTVKWFEREMLSAANGGV